MELCLPLGIFKYITLIDTKQKLYNLNWYKSVIIIYAYLNQTDEIRMIILQFGLIQFFYQSKTGCSW